MDPQMTTPKPTPTATPAAPAIPGGFETPDQAETFVADWMLRIKASEDVVQDLVERENDGWKANTKAYMGKVLTKAPSDHTVSVPIDFSYLELKKSQLAFQVPEVHLKPKNPESAAAVTTFQLALNHELGPENADAPTLIDEIATDVLICGIGASKIGYEADIRTRNVPVMVDTVDPTTLQPTRVQAIDPVTQEPQTKPEQFLAGEQYFWRRFPAEHLLLPVDFEETNFDRAAWVGMKYFMDFASAQKAYQLPPDFAGTLSTPRETLSSDERPDRNGGMLKQVECYEIWLQAAVFAPEEEPLPKQIKQLVIVKGLNRPVVYRDSPYQWVGPDGKLKGMEGFPIHPLTLRFLPGSAYPVSDVGMGRPLSEEISTYRSQTVRFRDRALPQQWYDRTRLTPDTLAKMERGDVMARIGIDGNGNEVIGVVAMPNMSRESWEGNEQITKDFEKTWAIRSPTVEPEGRTATEVRDASAVSDVRLDKERTKFLRWFTTGAAKFASLLQQYKDEPGYVEIVGPEGAATMQAWDRTNIQGEFVFTAKPDSALRMDADIERRQIANLYNLVGRDQNARRDEILKVLFQRHNMDPQKMVAPTPPPPEPKPEPPKISFAFKGEDLGNAQVLGILAQFGIEVMPPTDPMTGQPMPKPPKPPQQPGAPQQQPHPGAIPQADVLNKHALRGDGSAPQVN